MTFYTNIFEYEYVSFMFTDIKSNKKYKYVIALDRQKMNTK